MTNRHNQLPLQTEGKKSTDGPLFLHFHPTFPGKIGRSGELEPDRELKALELWFRFDRKVGLVTSSITWEGRKSANLPDPLIIPGTLVRLLSGRFNTGVHPYSRAGSDGGQPVLSDRLRSVRYSRSVLQAQGGR
jgi:hypothetical protein